MIPESPDLATEVILELSVFDTSAIMGTATPRPGAVIEVTDGVALQLKGIKRFAGPSAQDVLFLALVLARDIGVGVVAAALWELISKHRARGAVVRASVSTRTRSGERSVELRLQADEAAERQRLAELLTTAAIASGPAAAPPNEDGGVTKCNQHLGASSATSAPSS